MANIFLDEEDIKLRLNPVADLYPLQSDLNSRVEARSTGFNTSQAVTVSSAQFALIDSSMVSGSLAIGGTSTTQDEGGIYAASLAGAVGTAATTAVSNSVGQVLNLVNIVDAATNDPILDGGSRVFGLIQAASTVVDGDAIGAAASENTQISFVKYDGTDTLVLVTLNQDIQFEVFQAYAIRNTPNHFKQGGAMSTDIIDPTIPKVIETVYEITAQFEIGETITLATGAGSGSGTSTKVGATPLLPANAADFNSNGNVAIYKNGGPRLYKGTGNDVVWVSTGSFTINRKVKIGEILIVTSQNIYPA